jgi:hypothetical protein
MSLGPKSSWKTFALLSASVAASMALSAAVMLTSTAPASAMSANSGLNSAQQPAGVVLVQDAQQKQKRARRRAGGGAGMAGMAGMGAMGGMAAGMGGAAGMAALMRAIPPECINALMDDNLLDRWSCRAKIDNARRMLLPNAEPDVYDYYNRH